MAKMLCVNPSVTQQRIISALAIQHGLEVVVCDGESKALSLLTDDLKLMVVANELASGDSFQLIEAIRLSLPLARLPIAFVTSDHDRTLAANALTAGATEIFLYEDLDALETFIAECASQSESQELSGTVLLVEDSDSYGEYVAHLCRQLGMQVEKFKNVQSALASYRPGKYQLAVIDIVLDDIRTGIALVRSIRHNHQNRLPVIVMSGYEDLPRRLQALKSGADEFISKPFSAEEFIWRVKKVLRFHAALEAFDDSDTAPQESQSLMTRLSPREREICNRILSGVSDKEIARDLGISFWTVRSHIEQIFNKTGEI